ncbi:hypothetical protein BS17DRAFT_793093 [Gyrodon lividus]|nr:hypothetical protein BS17DRAFT_793093 [Gyrodon lividus]
MAWNYSGMTQKSAAELNRLTEFMRNPLFNTDDLAGFKHGWHKSSVPVQLPKEKVKCPELNAPVMNIPGVHHWSLVDIITNVIQDPVTQTFNMTPFEQYWKVSEECNIKVFSEAYSSPVMLDAYKEINALPRELDNNLECVIASLMTWLDSTHLTNFGDASLWPFYIYFGNQSKYPCGKPTSMACHHVAYIPSLPDNFQDEYILHYSEAATANVMSFCKQELFQSVWKLLLDKKFMHAYEHGMVIRCADGVTRHVFSQFFTYSADYPEKVLLASIKLLGMCLCPQCVVKKAEVSKMGMKAVMQCHATHRVDDDRHHCHIEQACQLIFDAGMPVNGARVKTILSDESLVLNHNAFSEKLSPHGFNLFLMLVVDLLHEFKLGVWKAIFIHLIWILIAAGEETISRMNA